VRVRSCKNLVFESTVEREQFFQIVLLIAYFNQERLMSSKVIPIESHEHFADYAEPANVVPVLPRKSEGETYDRYLYLGLAILGVCAVVAVLVVRFTWNP